MIHIRKAEEKDYTEIWEIIKPVIEKGDTYTFYPTSTKEQMLAYWCGSDKHCYVALVENKVMGTFIMKDNQPGLGSHVANASYMVSPQSSGKGIGRTMGEFSLQEAKKLGYRAMQFNMVVKTNNTAVELWKKIGFKIIGEIPEAFNHNKFGYTNAYIMYKNLE